MKRNNKKNCNYVTNTDISEDVGMALLKYFKEMFPNCEDFEDCIPLEEAVRLGYITEEEARKGGIDG